MVVNIKKKVQKQVVVDASFILTRLFPDEKYNLRVVSYFDQFSQGKLKFIAPALLKYEIANALRSGVIQRRLVAQIAQVLMREFLKLPITYQEVDFDKILQLAFKKQISAYDAAYVYLAQTKKLLLLSLDRKLVKIAG